MSSPMPQSPARVSPEIWAAARTRVPLRLPNPQETGPQCDIGRERHGAPVQSKPQHSRRVTSVRRQAPKPQLTLSDAELEALAQRVLLQSGVRGFTRLHVEVRGSVATLFGRLPTDIERQVAMQLVRRINGINGVEHEISLEELPVPGMPSGRRWGWWAAWSLVGSLVAALAGTFLI